jgi:hypothetical protein
MAFSSSSALKTRAPPLPAVGTAPREVEVAGESGTTSPSERTGPAERGGVRSGGVSTRSRSGVEISFEARRRLRRSSVRNQGACGARRVDGEGRAPGEVGGGVVGGGVGGRGDRSPYLGAPPFSHLLVF